MLTFKEFVSKFLGKKTDYDKYAGAQCVDLIKVYLKECFGIYVGSWGNAVDYFKRFDDPSWEGYEIMNKNFVRIKNSATFKPIEGDIVVYGERFSKNHDYGHIGIDSGESTLNTVVMYDQNATGNHDAMKKSSYFGYITRNCLGVLRPINRNFIVDSSKYFERYSGDSQSITDALKETGESSSYSYRKKIAAANTITGYKGTAAQNSIMLWLLKQGKLIKP